MKTNHKEDEDENIEAKMRKTGPIVIDENEGQNRPQTAQSGKTNMNDKQELGHYDDDLFGQIAK